MPLLRVVEHQDYRPEYGTLVIQDIPRPDRAAPRVGELLARHAVDTQPSGSFARAGDGWVEAVASADHRHTVRIEVHDTPPDDDDLSGCVDVLDTPLATSGLVTLALTVAGPIGGPIELGPPGGYRLRIARRPRSAGADPAGSACAYLLRLWPVAAPPAPPRWLRRTGPLVDPRPASERGAFDGSYRRAVTDVVMLALWAAESATAVTLAWLADRLLTTADTVRDIIEHPRAGRALRVAGDLDDVHAPLTVTALAKQPTGARTVSVPALPPRPGRAARPSTPARRSTPGVRGVPPVPARPAARRMDGERDA